MPVDISTVTVDPTRAYKRDDLIKILNDANPVSRAVREAMFNRLLDLGIRDAGMISNAIGNSSMGVEYVGHRYEKNDDMPKDELLARMGKLIASSATDKRTALKRTDDRYPQGALEAYAAAGPDYEPATRYTPPGGQTITLLDIEHAIVADIRRFGCEAALKHFGLSLPAESQSTAPAGAEQESVKPRRTSRTTSTSRV